MNTAFDLPPPCGHPPDPRLIKGLRSGLAGLSLALLVATAANATNTPAPETLLAATRALQGGAHEQAQQLLGTLRKQAPEDARVRFLQGVLQAQQGKADQAISTFRALTRSHPQWSEPYNNLGVLLAAKGQLNEARTAFEQALQTHPSYAAAHRNLLDVQSQMARQSLARALMTETGQPPVSPALTLLAALETEGQPPRQQPPQPVPAPSTVAAAPVAPAAPGTTVAMAPAATASSSKPAPNTQSPSPASSNPAATASAANGRAASTRRADKSPSPAATAQDGREEALRSSLQAWAKAWSAQAMPAYLGAYDRDFDPPKGMSRAQWEADRRLKITTKRSIDVDISQLEVQVRGTTATTQFRQVYTSDNLKVSSRKTLQWVWREGHWRITRETTG